jgi:uncharacterized membrane protein HdeD (DUF308 family)
MINVLDRTLTRSARMLALAGLASLAFGVLVLAKPGLSLVALLALFGAYTLVSGLFRLGAGLEHLAERRTDWVPYVLGGLAGIAVGGITFFRPGITALVLLYLIAGWAIVAGALQIPAAFALWDETHTSWLLGLAGALSIAFGILIAVYPVSGALTILWLIGIYAIAVGLAELVYAVRVHQTKSRVTHAERPVTHTLEGHKAPS